MFPTVNWTRSSKIIHFTDPEGRAGWMCRGRGETALTQPRLKLVTMNMIEHFIHLKHQQMVSCNYCRLEP
jgi:hypothetical protein